MRVCTGGRRHNACRPKQVPGHAYFPAHRSDRRAHMASSIRRSRICRRPAGTRAATGLGYDLFGQPVPGAAWKLKPTSYIVGSEDRTIQPELERFLAKRMNAKVTELASSHVPMLSQPRRVYEVIRDAAGNIERRAA